MRGEAAAGTWVKCVPSSKTPVSHGVRVPGRRTGTPTRPPLVPGGPVWISRPGEGTASELRTLPPTPAPKELREVFRLGKFSHSPDSNRTGCQVSAQTLLWAPLGGGGRGALVFQMEGPPAPSRPQRQQPVLPPQREAPARRRAGGTGACARTARRSARWT